MDNTDIPILGQNTDDVIKRVTEVLYQNAKSSKRKALTRDMNSTLGRWERLLENNDDRNIWKAINWKGEFEHSKQDELCPSDAESKEHYERCFNPPISQTLRLDVYATNVNIPILDDNITPLEVKQQIDTLKSDKVSEPDGVSPGILKILPAEWILLFTNIFNAVFHSQTYPPAWSKAKLFTVFKKGHRRDVKNYRAINVINSLEKLYDMVMCSQLKLWFKPFREQAGAQEKRGCLEHIVSLRLLCDTAKRKKFKLFVTLIDFSQAYDRVPRSMLF